MFRIFPFLFALIISCAGYVLLKPDVSEEPTIGRSSAELVSQLGLDLEPAVMDPLYRGYVRLHAGENVVGELNSNAVLMGSACLFLLFLFLYMQLCGLMEDSELELSVIRVVALLGAGIGTGFLFCSVPFRVLNLSTHSSGIDMLLLLLSGLALLLVAQRYHLIKLLLASLLIGLATIETSHLLVFLPLIALVILIVLVRNEVDRVGLIFACSLLLCVLPTLVFSAIAASQKVTGTEAEFYATTGFWTAFLGMLKTPFFHIHRSLPATGWMLALFFPTVVWLSTLATGRRAMSDYIRFTDILMNLVFTAVAVAMLLEMPVSPWRVASGISPMILPYLLIACVFGYLVSYWTLILGNALGGSGRTWLRVAIPGLVVSVLSIGFFVWQYPQGRELARDSVAASKGVRTLAEHMLDGVGTRSWLVTSGVVDDQILLGAYARGKDLSLIDASRQADPIYMRRLSKRFESPEIASFAQSSLVSLLRYWRTQPTFHDAVAMQAYPQVLYYGEYFPEPRRGVYVGASEGDGVSADELFSSHEVFWKEMIEVFGDAPEDSETLSSSYREYGLRDVSKNANDVGVRLVRQGHPRLAVKAFKYGLTLLPDNESVILNLLALLEQGVEVEDATAIRAKYALMAQSPKNSYQRSVRLYGTLVDSAAAFLPSDDMVADRAKLQQLRAGAEGKSRAMFDLALAASYALGREDLKSEEHYAEIVSQDPKNGGAWYALAALRLRYRDFERVERILERLTELEFTPEKLTVLKARLALAKKDYERVGELLKPLIESGAADGLVWGWRWMLCAYRGTRRGFELCDVGWSEPSLVLARWRFFRGNSSCWKGIFERQDGSWKRRWLNRGRTFRFWRFCWLLILLKGSLVRPEVIWNRFSNWMEDTAWPI